MSGESCVEDAHCNLLIVGGLESGLGNRRRGINGEVNLLVQQAVFVADDQPSFRVIFGDQEAEIARLSGHIEDEIRHVGLAGTERLREWSGITSATGEDRLSLRGRRETLSSVVDQKNLASVRR